jgi:hypothetical protein
MMTRRVAVVAPVRAVAGAMLVAPAAAPVAFATRRMFATPALRDEVGRQLAEEQANLAGVEKPTAPAGWTVEHKAGNGFFLVKKAVQDETVAIYCAFLKPAELAAHRAATGESDSAPPLALTISFHKADKSDALWVHGAVENGELVVDSAMFVPDAVAADHSANGDKVRSALYSGPGLSELDEALSSQVFEMIAARGVTDEVAQFVAEQAHALEQQAYMGWLKNLERFASA